MSPLTTTCMSPRRMVRPSRSRFAKGRRRLAAAVGGGGGLGLHGLSPRDPPVIGGYGAASLERGRWKPGAGSGAGSGGRPLSCGERVRLALRTSRRIVTARSLTCEGQKQARSADWDILTGRGRSQDGPLSLSLLFFNSYVSLLSGQLLTGRSTQKRFAISRGRLESSALRKWDLATQWCYPLAAVHHVREGANHLRLLAKPGRWRAVGTEQVAVLLSQPSVRQDRVRGGVPARRARSRFRPHERAPARRADPVPHEGGARRRSSSSSSASLPASRRQGSSRLRPRRA